MTHRSLSPRTHPFHTIYDAFGHSLGRTNLNWGEDFNYGEGPFVNNKLAGVGNSPDHYDSDGRPRVGFADQTHYEINNTLKTITRESKYDYEADGRISVTKEMVTIDTETYGQPPVPQEVFEGSHLTPYYDGDGDTIRVSGWDAAGVEAPREIVPRIDEYSIRSTVLGGRVVSEYKAHAAFGGNKYRTTIYAGGAAIAWQGYWQGQERIAWNYGDPARTWQREDWWGEPTHTGKELDPMGTNIGLDHTSVEPVPPQQPLANPIAGGFAFDVDPSELRGPTGQKIVFIVDGMQMGPHYAWLYLAGGIGNVREDESDRFTLAMLGLVEVQRRVEVNGTRGGVRDPDNPRDYSEEVTAPRGYRIESSWELTSYSNPFDASKAVDEGKSLPDCTQKILQPYFEGLDLNGIRVHPNGLPWYVQMFNTVDENGPGAFTFGNDVYFPDVLAYKPYSVSGLTDLAHEIAHSYQYQDKGSSAFMKEYFGDYFRNIRDQMNGGSGFDAARDAVNDFLSDLKNTPTFDPTARGSSSLLRNAQRAATELGKVKDRLDLHKAYEDIQIEKDARELAGEVRQQLNKRFPSGLIKCN